MHRYTRLLLTLFFAMIVIVAGLELSVDPYDVLHGPRIAGFNADKTRSEEDGRRVTVADEILEGGHGTLLFGTSRAVDGFPHELGPEAWPGGLYDAGIRGSNAFELVRAIAIAGRSPDLRCIVVGLEYSSYSAANKDRSTYWISALPDGNRLGSIARTALSPHAFWRSLQTVKDNLLRHAPPGEHPRVYAPGEQRKDTLEGAQSYLRGFKDFDYDPARLRFLFAALDALSARGVQIVGLVFPSHILKDEGEYAAGQYGKEELWLRAIVDHFAKLAANPAIAPCLAGQPSAVVWDFSGYRTEALSALPGAAATAPQPYFYEAAHFTPLVGTAMLDRMLERKLPPPFDAPDFGERLTPDNLDARGREVMARRAAWLASDSKTARIGAALDARAKTVRDPVVHAFLPLERDDWIRLKKDVKAMASYKARAARLAKRARQAALPGR